MEATAGFGCALRTLDPVAAPTPGTPSAAADDGDVDAGSGPRTADVGVRSGSGRFPKTAWPSRRDGRLFGSVWGPSTPIPNISPPPSALKTPEPELGDGAGDCTVFGFRVYLSACRGRNGLLDPRTLRTVRWKRPAIA